MKEKLTDSQVKEKLKRLEIICDTREQKNDHIIGYFTKNKILNKARKLDEADYSFELDGISFEDEVSIERKANWDELAGNITKERNRLEGEFFRAKAQGKKVFLLIENGTYADLLSGNYESNLNPNSFFSTLMAWQARFNLTIILCRKSESGKIIHGIGYYWVRERL